MRKHALVGWLLLAPSLCLLGGLVVFPVLYNVWLSLFDKHAFMPVQAFVGLRHYRYKVDPDTGQRSKEPFHDWASNPADAFRYFAVATSEPREKQQQRSRRRAGSWMRN